ncbi:NAD(P)H-dependent oxidoreductase [Paenibacillus sp. PL2-23]|uniref:NAD(P)H-dependent oxidoreductase n=1 Tax=Paenibacillus sp. PL2-23 TaxID=2100729 RepID=UPI0030F68E89
MLKEQILEAYRFRHATKEFDVDRKVSRADFDFIMETGRLSPSSFGFEPWKFLIVQSSELRSKLLPITWGAQKTLPTASHFMVLLTRTADSMHPSSQHIQTMMREVQQLPEEVIGQKGERYGKFLEHDFELLGNDRAMFEWASRQTYIALGNMMTAAAMIGIDSCPIEGFDKHQVEELLRSEGLLKGNEFGVSCMAAFGYRAREPREKTRRAVEQIVQWVE